MRVDIAADPADAQKALYLKNLVRVGFKGIGNLPAPARWLRRAIASGALLMETINPHTDGAEDTLANIPTRRWGLKTRPELGAVLYIHGGAFFAGSPDTHKSLLSAWAKKTKSSVYAIDYRLAPENPYPAAIDDALTAYEALLARGYKADDIVIAGDSAGGGLALTLLQRIKRKRLTMPAAAVLISPFVDLTLSGESMAERSMRDPMLNARMLSKGAGWYSAGAHLDDPDLSPLFGDLKLNLPILIQVGSEEVLLDDALRLHAGLDAARVDVTCELYDTMWHDFQLNTGLLKTADAALEKIVSFAQGAVLTRRSTSR